MQKAARLFVATATLLLSGCMSLGGTFIDEDKCNKVYAGTRIDIECLTSGGHNIANAPVCLVDLPFSAIADTVFLVYTVPVSISSCNKNSELR